MKKNHYSFLNNRACISISGEDRETFLQGLISNDVREVSKGKSVWAAFLTPQGKFLHAFFVIPYKNSFILECDKERLDDLYRRLKLYKLRSQVNLEKVVEDYKVAAIFENDTLGIKNISQTVSNNYGVFFVDPRHEDMGIRGILKTETADDYLKNFILTDTDTYHKKRIDLSIPDGVEDLPVEKAILLENGFDELNAISWDKGCFLGQELTARTKYRGLVRKRLFPIIYDQTPESSEQLVMQGDKKVGVTRSFVGQKGLALIKIEAVKACLEEGVALTVNGQNVTPDLPEWLQMSLKTLEKETAQNT